MVYSTRPRVSVCGTGARTVELSGFSREYDYPRCRPPPRGTPYFQVRLPRRTSLPLSAPTPFNAQFRLRAAVPLLRPRFTLKHTNGILTVSSIGCALRLPLRSRLTLIRLALIRNPWPSGEGVSRPLCRYLCLHLLFQTLQRGSPPAFDAAGMLPYRYF